MEHQRIAIASPAQPRAFTALVWLLIEECAGRFPFDATGDERHDRGLGSVLYRA